MNLVKITRYWLHNKNPATIHAVNTWYLYPDAKSYSVKKIYFAPLHLSSCIEATLGKKLKAQFKFFIHSWRKSTHFSSFSGKQTLPTTDTIDNENFSW